MQINDPLFPKQEPLFGKLEVLDAWRLTKGSPEVVIGVIDNGFDFFHPDLEGQLIPGFYASGGYHTEIYENVAHGTMVSSLIVAKENNGIGMAGLAPGCKVLTASNGTLEHTLIKVQQAFMKEHPDAKLEDWQKEMDEHGDQLLEFGEKWTSYQSRATAKGIRYLVDHGARIINISGFLKKGLVGSVEACELLDDAFSYAKSRDVILVIGAGNMAEQCEDYPGEENSTIIVGATTLDDERWEIEAPVMQQTIKQGSNYGTRLTVMAPSQNLVVCTPHDKRFYSSEDGPTGPSASEFKAAYDTLRYGATSCATAVVTALVALVRSLRPDLSVESVIETVKEGSDDIGEKGFDIYTGYGRVNFAETVEVAGKWGK